MPSYDGEKVRHAKINASSSGDNTVIPAVSGKYLIVLAYNFVCGGDVDVKWKSGSTDISGAAPFISTTGKVVTGGQWPVLKTGLGEALVMNLSASVQVGGELTYSIADRDDY